MRGIDNAGVVKRGPGRPREIPKRYKTKGARNWYRLLKKMIAGGASRLAIRVMKNRYGNSEPSSAPRTQQSVPGRKSWKDAKCVRRSVRGPGMRLRA